MVTATREITCHYIDTCYPDYLQDHHNRGNELLILSTPISDRDGLEASLLDFAFNDDSIPESISDSEVKSAISKMLTWLFDIDSNLPTEDKVLAKEPEEDLYLYAYLSW